MKLPKMTQFQRTLKKSVSFSGITLHTGVRVKMTIEPAPEDTGIQFIREDLKTDIRIPAHIQYTQDVQRATTIGVDQNHFVVLVEHVLSSLFGLGIDNAIIRMNGPEPPVGDGSAKIFTEGILKAGIQKQKRPAYYFTVSHPVHLRQKDSLLIFLPGKDSPSLRITCMISYPVSSLAVQYFSIELTPENYLYEIAPARTFCEDYAQIANLMKMGLIRGASLDNAMVICDGAIICKEGGRFHNELVRHKMLDIVGDFALLGRRLCGEVVACLPGHPLNVALARHIVNQNLLIKKEPTE